MMALNRKDLKFYSTKKLKMVRKLDRVFVNSLNLR